MMYQVYTTHGVQMTGVAHTDDRAAAARAACIAYSVRLRLTYDMTIQESTRMTMEGFKNGDIVIVVSQEVQ